jgi:ribosomal protein RSM22 (predicted rRNA methylase)
MQLPSHLRQAIDDIVARTATADIQRAAGAVSERYRRVDGQQKALSITSSNEATAYAATRLPATYCAMARVLSELSFDPASLLDIGAGPGTATLAALENFSSLEDVKLLEPNIHLRATGSELLSKAYPEKTAAWLASGAEQTAFPETDLVVSGYVLNEIKQEKGEDDFVQTVRKMWQAAKHTLVIVEPGTPAGQSLILQARQILLGEGAHMIAPCPHTETCPIAARWKAEEKWCHFSVRVERSRMHIQSKPGAVLGYEDEKFSYLVVSRYKSALPRYRVVGHPHGKKVMNAEVCVADGSYQDMQTAKSAPDYKAFRKAEWGDGIY